MIESATIYTTTEFYDEKIKSYLESDTPLGGYLKESKIITVNYLPQHVQKSIHDAYGETPISENIEHGRIVRTSGEEQFLQWMLSLEQKL